jgi:hypothetical protein
VSVPRHQESTPPHVPLRISHTESWFVIMDYQTQRALLCSWCTALLTAGRPDWGSIMIVSQALRRVCGMYYCRGQIGRPFPFAQGCHMFL